MRGPDHEEAPPSQADPAIRRLHQRGAHLHHHRAHEERQLAGVSPGQGPDDEAPAADRYERPGGGGDGLPRESELHPQGPSGQVSELCFSQHERENHLDS